MKIKIVSLLFLMYGLVFSQQGFSPVKDTELFKSKLDGATSRITSIESDFVQEKRISVLTETISSKGKFWFQKDNKLRWEYLTPYKYLIVMNGEKISIRDENKTNNFDTRSNQMFKKIADIMSAGLQGKISGFKDFTPTFYENDKFYLIKLVPQSKLMKDYFSSINMYLNNKDFTVTKLEMNEPSGDYTVISFKEKKLNHQISNEKFIIR